MQINENLLIQQFNRMQKNKRYVHEDSDSAKIQTISGLKKGVYQAEKAIIAFLIGKNSDIKRFIMEYVTPDMFENSELAHLYNHLLIEYEETGNTDINKILLHESDDDQKNKILTELAMDEYTDNLKYARDCVYQIKKWHLEKSAKELSAFIKAESDSQESVMHYIKELGKIRKEIAELESQFRIQS
jgi:hypothetical protein